MQNEINAIGVNNDLKLSFLIKFQLPYSNNSNKYIHLYKNLFLNR